MWMILIPIIVLFGALVFYSRIVPGMREQREAYRSQCIFFSEWEGSTGKRIDLLMSRRPHPRHHYLALQLAYDTAKGLILGYTHKRATACWLEPLIMKQIQLTESLFLKFMKEESALDPAGV